jgi:hypothetical protein
MIEFNYKFSLPHINASIKNYVNYNKNKFNNFIINIKKFYYRFLLSKL